MQNNVKILKKIIGLYILHFLFILLALTYSLSANIILTDDKKMLDDFTLSYLYDASHLLNIDQVSKKEFTKTTRSQFSFGYVNGTTWYKLTLTNKSHSEEYVLSFLEAFSDGLNLYHEENDSFVKSENGLLVPLDKREYYDSYPTFSLKIKKGETKTYYIEAFSKFSSAGEFIIYEHKTYSSKGKPLLIALYMFYFGSLIMVIFFNLFLSITNKDRLFSYYTAYIFFYTMFVFVASGFDLYLGYEHLHGVFHIVSPLLVAFLILFSSYFLQTKLFYPKLYKLLMLNFSIYIVLTPLVFITVEPWIEVVNFITPLTFVMLIVIAVMTSIKGYSLAKYYLVIMLTYIASLALMNSVLMGYIQNNHFNRYIFMLASYLEILTFSVLLASIYNRTKKEADRDSLTGLYNRRYFSNEADKQLKLSKIKKQAFSILMIDIDKFKGINDRYGHPIGDKVLIQTSNRLIRQSRIQDIVSRYGGEEFIILLPNTTINQAKVIAEVIRKDVEKMLIVLDDEEEEEEITITISIGLSQSVSSENLSMGTIIQEADANLYRAKESGRNRVYYA